MKWRISVCMSCVVEWGDHGSVHCVFVSDAVVGGGRMESSLSGFSGLGDPLPNSSPYGFSTE